MKDETLRNILKNLNTGRGKNLLYRRPIGGNIEFAKGWIWQRNKYTYKSQTFFLIKNDTGKYVAIVYGANNFHWYTLYEERGKGYLSNALRNIILPFIWRENLASIDYPLEVTISRGIGPKNFQASIKLAKAIGFKMDVENEDIAKLKIDYDEPVPIGEAWR